MHKRDLVRLLAAPSRYRELKPLLLAYMPKTPYKRLASFEDALRQDHILFDQEVPIGTGSATALFSSVDPERWTPYQVAQALFPNGYFCNLTSVYYHSLTNQVPARVYVAVETARKKDRDRARIVRLSDHDIFEAFVQPPRVSKHVYRFHGHEITMTERISRACIGVETVHDDNRVCPKGARVTSLERALIDAAVHPQYNGGLATVLELLRVGLARVNERQFVELYDKLAYVYPYWQAIGFVCDRLGFPGLAAAMMHGVRPRNKFYLDHLAKTSWQFDPKWQLYYPKGVL
jgi:predicted transcriptional regulator of viral defense system